MGLPDTACITFRLSQAVYRPLFEEVWGAGSFAINFPSNTEQICDTPNGAAIFGGSATPVNLSPADRTRSNNVYDEWGLSLSAYEHSLSVSPFTSKFDAFLKHAADTTPVFTCFGSANRRPAQENPRVALYYETTPDFFGFTPNPEGFAYTDFGIGTFLRSGFGSAPNPNVAWIQFAGVSDGKMQTMTARNVAMVPPKCPTTEAPGPYFQKEFFHNGYIKSLKQLVHFYNTRDVYRMQVESGQCPPGTIEKVTCWPAAEVPQNQDMTVGNLHLTDVEENQIVKFMQTLTDGLFTSTLPRHQYLYRRLHDRR